MPDSQQKLKNNIKDFIIFIIPTIISLVAIFQAGSSNRLAEKANAIANLSVERTEYDDIPSFDILHNIWSDTPSYTLYNESSKKLAYAPHPSYLMFIPSKLYWINSDTGELDSNLILSPVSYQHVTQQLREPTSIGKIETSYLPKSFFGKKGERDIIYNENLEFFKEAKDIGLDTRLATYPFMVIVSKIEYQYFDDEEIHKDYIVSTPLGKHDITEEDYLNLINYIKDNAFLEITGIPDNQSVYQIANNEVTDHLNSLKVDKEKLSMLGGVEGGYGFVLKTINQLITPEDPIISE